MKHILTFLGFILVTNTILAQVKVQDAATINPAETYENVKVLPVYTDENSSSFMIFVKQKVRRHMHLYHTEVVTVLEGTGEFYLAGETLTIKAGDHIVIPPGTPHGVKTTSKKPLKVLSVQSPEFIGEDRVFVKEEEPAAATATKATTTDKNKDKEENDGDDDIPEYEGG